MKNFREALREEMTDPEFKNEWDTLEPEFNRIRETLREKNISTTSVTFDSTVALQLLNNQSLSQRSCGEINLRRFYHA